MKNFISIIVICVFSLGFGMGACKSKGSTKPETSNESAKPDENLVEKKWTLFELNGVALPSPDPQSAIEAFIIFQIDGNRVHGNSGCNNFSGTYQSGDGTALHFSNDMVSTRKMCIDMTVEEQMNQLFQKVDNYTLQDNILSLNQGETSLARFTISKP